MSCIGRVIFFQYLHQPKAAWPAYEVSHLGQANAETVWTKCGLRERKRAHSLNGEPRT